MALRWVGRSALLAAACTFNISALPGTTDAADAGAQVDGGGDASPAAVDGGDASPAAVDGAGDASPAAVDGGGDARAATSDATTCLHDGDDDGTCDEDDRCPGGDDRQDVDGDGTPDACDRCNLDGPLAPMLPTSVTASDITISGVDVNGVGWLAHLEPEQHFTLELSYVIEDCGCPACLDEIEIGLVPGAGVAYCAYQGIPGCSGNQGRSVHQLVAPATPGEYFIRFDRRQDYGCGTSWWTGTPPETQSIAAICVY